MSEQIKFLKGSNEANLPSSLATGSVYFCEDTGNLYIGDSNKKAKRFASAVGKTVLNGSNVGEIFNDYTNNKAKGNYSHAEGIGTLATGNYQHVQGKYNLEDTANTFAHIVGNGSSSTRANMHTLDWNGNAWFLGDVFVGGTNKNNAVKLVKTNEVYNENYGQRWYSLHVNNTSSNNVFYKIADIKMTSGYGTYDAAKIVGYLYDHNGNWEQNETYKIPFQAIINITDDNAKLYSTALCDSDHIRIVKTATRTYELQVRCNSTHCDYDVYFQVLSNKGVTVYETQQTASTTGTVITITQTKSFGNYANEAIKATNDSNNNKIVDTYATKAALTSHTGNTGNPHSVTKAQVGLGNVENKSSATIRGELTKSNVTTALGYTPVNKAGDTMSGSLNIGASTNTSYLHLLIDRNINSKRHSVVLLPDSGSGDAVLMHQTNGTMDNKLVLSPTETWLQQPLAIASGGTAAKTAADARTNLGAASASDLSTHVGNKSNPHAVTKAQVGLGNVENKSSATIRGELTKSNVTTALGYTPIANNTVATSSALGLVKSGTDITIDSNGNVSVNDSSHNHAASNITSGTLSSSRLPTVPITKGGTGGTNATTAVSNLGLANVLLIDSFDSTTGTLNTKSYS